MARHRVPLLHLGLRRRVDPAHSRDPRIRALVADLAALPIAPDPDPQFRAELRAQLVAITPRVVAESSADTASSGATAAPARASAGATASPASPARVPATGGTAPAGRPHRRIALGRPLAVTASVLVVLTLLLGGAVWMSRKALPGDTLYGLKRAGERLQLSTASSDQAKAHDYLRFAATRAAEVRALWARSTSTALGPQPVAAGRPSSSTQQLILEALTSSDSDVRSASQLLTAQAVRSRSAAPLDTMTDWAPGQQQQLRALAETLPAGPLRAHATSSAAIVAAARARAVALATVVHCSCLSGAPTDLYGPRPCAPCSAPARAPGQRAPTGGATASTIPRSGARKAPKSSAPAGGSTGRKGSGSGTGTTKRSGSVNRPSVPKVSLPHLPGLPTSGHPSVPGVRVGTCGISASPLGIKIGVVLCPSGIAVSVHP